METYSVPSDHGPRRRSPPWGPRHSDSRCRPSRFAQRNFASFLVNDLQQSSRYDGSSPVLEDHIASWFLRARYSEKLALPYGSFRYPDPFRQNLYRLWGSPGSPPDSEASLNEKDQSSPSWLDSLPWSPFRPCNTLDIDIERQTGIPGQPHRHGRHGPFLRDFPDGLRPTAAADLSDEFIMDRKIGKYFLCPTDGMADRLAPSMTPKSAVAEDLVPDARSPSPSPPRPPTVSSVVGVIAAPSQAGAAAECAPGSPGTIAWARRPRPFGRPRTASA